MKIFILSFISSLCRESGVILSYYSSRSKPTDYFLYSPTRLPFTCIWFVWFFWLVHQVLFDSKPFLVDTILYCVIMAETLATGGAETQIKTAVRRPRALSAWLGNKSTDILWSCPVLQEHVYIDQLTDYIKFIIPKNYFIFIEKDKSYSVNYLP